MKIKVENNSFGMSWEEFMYVNSLQEGDRIRHKNDIYTLSYKGVHLPCGGLSYFRTLYMLEGTLEWELYEK